MTDIKCNIPLNKATSTLPQIMFHLAMFIRCDGVSINPFTCTYICSYIRNGTVVITEKMLALIGGIEKIEKLEFSTLVVISSSNLQTLTSEHFTVVVVKDIHAAIKHLSLKHQGSNWWFIGDNESSTSLIRKGLIMNVHLSKSYDPEYSNEWKSVSENALHQTVLFEKDLLEEDDFELISNVRCLSSKAKSVRHYMRSNHEELALLSAMYKIIQNGFKRPNRTGVDTRSLFGQQFEYRMVERIDPQTGVSSYRLPLLTTKKMFTRGVFAELKWFLGGGTDSKTLESKGVNIWKGNTTKEFLDASNLGHYDEGETGPIYGFQWKHWGAEYVQGKHDYAGEGIDQVNQVVQSLETNPYSRRHIISGWNVADIDKMCLPPCHVLYQFLVHEEGDQKYLSLMMTQRSCDVFLGLPFNICSLGMFLTIMAHRVGMKPFKIIHSVADFHLYETHIEAANKQLARSPCCFPYISLKCDPKQNLEDYDYEDVVIEDYYPHGPIKADMVA